VVALDGDPVQSVGDLQRQMVSELIGRDTRLTVVRDERVLELPLVPAELVA
jgi:S1-C subfamily serine protease